MNFLISFGICSTPKLSKYNTFLTFTCKAIQSVPIDSYPSRFIKYNPSFILDHLFLDIVQPISTNVPDSIGRNPLFCSFALFLIVSLISFTSNHDFSRNLTIFLISSISSFEIAKAVVPDP